MNVYIYIYIYMCIYMALNKFSGSNTIPPQYFFKLGFTPCKAEQTLGGMELQEKEVQKD